MFWVQLHSFLIFCGSNFQCHEFIHFTRKWTEDIMLWTLALQRQQGPFPSGLFLAVCGTHSYCAKKNSVNFYVWLHAMAEMETHPRYEFWEQHLQVTFLSRWYLLELDEKALLVFDKSHWKSFSGTHWLFNDRKSKIGFTLQSWKCISLFIFLIPLSCSKHIESDTRIQNFDLVCHL